MGDVKTDVKAKIAELADTGPRDLVAPPEADVEIIDQTDIFDEVISAANKLEAYAKAQDQILNIIVKRTYAGDWVCHDRESAPEAERKANLGAAGAERIANFLGVQEANWKEYPKEWSEDHKHYSYAYSADFTFRGVTRHAVGRAGTRDKFFSGGKAMEDINEDDIRVAAFRECFKKGVTRLFGLRNIPLTKLTSLGYDKGLVKMVEFENKGKQISAEDKKAGSDGLIEKTIIVSKASRDTGKNKTTGKEWVRWDIFDKEGVKYAVWNDGTRATKLSERAEDQLPTKIKFKIVAANGREGHPDYGREITLILNCLDGYPAVTNRAPEDCYPGDGDQYEILSAVYEDETPVPTAIIEAISDDVIQDLIKEPVW